MKPTFQQLCAAICTGICLLSLLIMYFVKGTGENAAQIYTTIAGAFTTSLMWLLKASSDAKNADTISQMTDALANSAPAVPKS